MRIFVQCIEVPYGPINENSWITNSEDAFLAIKCLGNETLAKIFLEIGGFKDSYLEVTEVREL